MVGLLLRSRWLNRLSRGVPVARLVLVGEVGLMARRHFLRLERGERRRLLVLLAKTRGRPGRLTRRERAELALLLAKLEARLFLGSAIKRLSPVPVPRRLLYGPRGSATRAALSRPRH
jgi:hypothetical protein